MGLQDIVHDAEMNNVYGRWPGAQSTPALLISAHTDTVFGIDTDLTACLKTCTDASQCAAGLACVSLGSQKACVFGCESNAECKTGETCSRTTGACIKG